MANVDVTAKKEADNQDSDDIDVVQNIFRVILHFIRVILEIIFLSSDMDKQRIC